MQHNSCQGRTIAVATATALLVGFAAGHYDATRAQAYQEFKEARQAELQESFQKCIGLGRWYTGPNGAPRCDTQAVVKSFPTAGTCQGVERKESGITICDLTDEQIAEQL